MKQRRKQSGFTLMEAIVALVLLATTGMALFSWINSNVITLHRVQTSNAQDEATLNALQYINSVNPMTQPQGQADLGSYQLKWTTEQLTEPRDGAGYPTGISLYQLAMYKTRVDVQHTGGAPWFDFSLQQVGYRRVREIKPPL